MQKELIEILCCPQSGQRLSLENPAYRDNDIYSGWLVSENGKYRYPIKNFIPRFVPESNYADNFGMQWNEFRQTQLDSYSGHPISATRFWKATGWRPDELEGKWLLDAGCGAGRFAEIALQAGAKVVALDYSTAVDACYSNLKKYSNLYVVQGDIYTLPFVRKFFPFVYSLGVLQHTPDVEKSFLSLPPMVAQGGKLCADFYWKRFRTMLHAKYLFRPISKRIPKQKLFVFLQQAMPILLKVSRMLGAVPLIGVALKRLIPIADYTGIYPLTEKQIKEWALLDTFDMLAPEYDNPKTMSTVKTWFESIEFINVEIFHAGHLVGRGERPS